MERVEPGRQLSSSWRGDQLILQMEETIAVAPPDWGGGGGGGYSSRLYLWKVY